MEPFVTWVEGKMRDITPPQSYTIGRVGGRYYLNIKNKRGDFTLVDFKDVPLQYVQMEATIQDLYKADEAFREYLDR